MSALPVETILPDLIQALTTAGDAILQAPPGSGKTTFIPLALLRSENTVTGKILLLEPRRLAVKNVASYMAQQLGEQPGDKVGYRMRLESRVSAKTRIEVVTEGVLLRLLQADPSLEGYSLLIFDEFHERSLESDLGLAMALYARALFREDDPLKLLLMSATLENSALQSLLPQAPLITASGQLYPVDIKYAALDLSKRPLGEAIAMQLFDILAETQGSLLVFLPGQAEIRAVESVLHSQPNRLQGCLITPLYGDMDLAAQQTAIAPPPKGTRKLVLATNIAETSLTIEGIRVVVDAGLCKMARFDPNTAMTRLHTQRISNASATQRAGRAGRLEPGICYRLWSTAQQAELAAHLPPAITQADLAPMVLLLANWGITRTDELDWLDKPTQGAWSQAQGLLKILAALDPDGQITPLGEAMLSLPCHPRLAHLLLRVDGEENLSQACSLAALLSDRDPLRLESVDIETRLEWLQQPSPPHHKSSWHRMRQQARQFRQIREKIESHGLAVVSEPLSAGLLITLAYPDRIASQRQPQGTDYRLSNGRAVRLEAGDPLRQQGWLAVAATRGLAGQRQDQITLAAPLEINTLRSVFPEYVSISAEVYWDRDLKKVMAQELHTSGALTLFSKPLEQPDPDQVHQTLIDQLRRDGLDQLSWTPTHHLWRQRVMFLRNSAPESEQQLWPDLSDAALLNTLEDWLLPFLQGERRFEQLTGQTLATALHALLPWSSQQQLDQLAPTHLTLPSGSRVAIDYSEVPPVLAAKLQELFGWQQTPQIGYGTGLKLHLLSPARRPVQITMDLANFWHTTYADVKKDLKGRYPKHDWPDDPTQAIASRGVKRRPSH